LGAPVHKAICLNGVSPAEVTYRGLAEAVAGRAVLLLKGLEGYASDYPTSYDWETEATAIARVTAERGLQQFHVMGYSAGASVALGFACSFPDHVESLHSWTCDTSCDSGCRPSLSSGICHGNSRRLSRAQPFRCPAHSGVVALRRSGQERMGRIFRGQTAIGAPYKHLARRFAPYVYFAPVTTAQNK
jgi:hypothetical protein